MSKVIAAIQSGRLPMPTTEPAANPQGLTEEMVEAALNAMRQQEPLAINMLSPHLQRSLAHTAITAALSLSRPAADRGRETCPFCGGDELNLADNEYRSRAIARLNNIARGQIVEECARVVYGEVYKERYRTWPAIPNYTGNRSDDSEIVKHCNALAAAIRALSPTETEPDFLSQTSEPMTREQRSEWFRMRVSEASKQGATWHRYSSHPDDESMLLYEGWRVRPENAGEPRFQFTPGAEKG